MVDSVERGCPEYSEDINDYKNEVGLYAWNRLAARIALMDAGDPCLALYRDDLIRMIDANTDFLVSKARQLEHVFKDPVDETSARLARSQFENMMTLVEENMRLSAALAARTRSELIDDARRLTQQGDAEW